MYTYGQNLRAAREATGESLRKVARALDVSPSYLSDVELDRRTPSDALEADLCAYLEITPADLGNRAADVMRRLRPRLADPRFLAKVVKLIGDPGKAPK